MLVEMKMVVSGRQINTNQRHDDKIMLVGSMNLRMKIAWVV